MDSDLLKAFLEQGGIDPNADQSADNDYWADPIQREKEESIKGQAMALRIMNEPGRKSIANHIEIPTNITNKDIEGKTGPHPNLANYDHSLEQDRWKGKRGYVPRAGEDPDYPVDENGVIQIDL